MFPIETISAKMLDYYVDRPDTLIIDLREPESYRKSHIRGAVNIPDSRVGSDVVLLCGRCFLRNLSCKKSSKTEPDRGTETKLNITKILHLSRGGGFFVQKM